MVMRVCVCVCVVCVGVRDNIYVDDGSAAQECVFLRALKAPLRHTAARTSHNAQFAGGRGDRRTETL